MHRLHHSYYKVEPALYKETNSLQYRHNEHDCLLNRLFRGRSKKTSQLRVTGLYEGNSPVTDEFPPTKGQ